VYHLALLDNMATTKPKNVPTVTLPVLLVMVVMKNLVQAAKLVNSYITNNVSKLALMDSGLIPKVKLAKIVTINVKPVPDQTPTNVKHVKKVDS